MTAPDHEADTTAIRPGTPKPGHVQVVLLVDDRTLVGETPASGADALMDAFEMRAKLTPDERGDQVAQASIRMEVARSARGDKERAEADFTEVLAAACLWLAMRHWSKSEDMRRGLAEQLRAGGSAVLTCSIGELAGAHPDTAWSFMIGDRIHDGRERLAAVDPGAVTVIAR